MLWDIYCQVIDNFGDVGVCWRLARELSARGESVRLWLDDDRPLRWMAPQQPGEAAPRGIEVRDWAQAGLGDEAVGDVVIEAFGCHLPEALVARMAAAPGVRWVNLEYLSAEAYVERSHGLPSPVMSGPGAGLNKRFFYPGFTPRTGGLLHPVDDGRSGLGAAPWQASDVQRRALRQRLLATLPAGLPGEPHLSDARASAPTSAATEASQVIAAPWVLAFCYASAPLGAMLDAIAAHPAPQAIQVWLTPGPATEMAMRWQAARPATDALLLRPLPAVPQHTFDAWLDACDLRLVRGEDSAVRALWAGRPHLWQLYEQDDGVHADKLQAFLDRWMADWPADLRAQLTPWWQLWNGLRAPETWSTLPPLPEWHAAIAPEAPPWQAAQTASTAALATHTDLCTQLMEFVKA
jgi:uncharacterized repeat protein (TIGR03837 family)